MSAAKASTAVFPVAAAMSAAAARDRARSRPVMPTRAPSAASPAAVALPMPPVPPVTSTVLPAIRPVMLSVMTTSFVHARELCGRRCGGWTDQVVTGLAVGLGVEPLDEEPERQREF